GRRRCTLSAMALSYPETAVIDARRGAGGGKDWGDRRVGGERGHKKGRATPLTIPPFAPPPLRPRPRILPVLSLSESAAPAQLPPQAAARVRLRAPVARVHRRCRPGGRGPSAAR